jgi:methyl-accepting chemotaxis protein
MKLTIGFKMSVGLLVMLLLMIVPGAAGFTSVRNIGGLTSALAGQHDESSAIWTIKVAVIETSAAFKAELAQRLETSHLEFNNLYEEVRGKLQAREPVNREEFEERMDRVVNDYTTVLDDLQSEFDKNMGSTLEEAGHIQTRTLSLVAGFTIAAAILGVALAWGITRSVTRPVRRLVEVADNISMGDLDMPVEVTSRDEIGELQESIERMRVSLKTVLERLKKQR